MSQMESEVERKVKKVCKKAMMYEDALEKSMMTMTDFYNKNRRDIVGRYSKTDDDADYSGQNYVV